MFGTNEPFASSMVQPFQQRVEEAFDIEQSDRLLVYAELPPSEDLAQLLGSAKPARQGDKGVGQRSHQRLSFVHRIYDVKPAQAGVRDFLCDQGVRYHSDNLASSGQGCVRQRPHQTGASPSID